MPSLGDAFLYFKADKSDLDKGFRTAEADATSFTGRVGNVIGAGLKTAFAVGAVGITGAMAGIFKGIASNADFEAFQAQFESLYGTIDSIADPVASAQKHIEDLNKFASKTPFDLPGVITASKTLLTFGGVALDTQENLTMVGNAAAAAGKPIDQVSTYVGKAYSAIQNGQPFGEAAAELQNMGILTGDARRELEKMQAEGKSGPEVWAAFQAGLTAPTDAMDKLGKTWGGMMSTMGDTVDGAMRSATKPLFDILKPALESTLAFLNTPEVQGAIADFGTKLGNGILAGVTIIQGMVPVFEEGFRRVGAAINFVKPYIDTLIAVLGPPLMGAFTAISGVVSGLVASFSGGGLQGGISGILGALGQISPTFQIIRAVFDSAFAPIQSIIETMFTVVSGFIATSGADIMATVQNVWGTVQSIIDSVIPPIQLVVSTIFGAIATFLAEHGAEIQATLTKVWTTISTVITATLDFIQTYIVPILTAIAGFIAAHATEIQSILSGVWTAISGIVNGAMDIIQGIIKTVMAIIHGDWSGAWEGIKQIFGGVWTAIGGILTGALDIIQAVITVAWDSVSGIFSRTWSAIESAFTTTWDNLKKGVDAVLTPIVDAITTAWNTISSLTSTIFNGIKDTIGGIWDGILVGLKAPINAAIDAVNSLIEGASTIGEAIGFDPIPQIPRLYKGTNNFAGGLMFGGERGPEAFKTPGGQVGVLTGGLYTAPPGTQVIPHGGGSGQSISISMPITIQGNADQSTVDKIGQMVEQKIGSVLQQYMDSASLLAQ